ncbi:hypothetical protein P691DRAFT_794509 [Macrolepiota fuliginosa MF-IS2]|uniref:HRDC domain-containing protein n=1 Tax=Macrolepiota fuliginosa MF-IS2 TaxID=1400762 RepID=A0A9P5X941_9AGAR|nr:hypothetical protein P691DRAFT_794509 [Macrolepiota fuliginosa MF-IS2]
MDSSISSSSFDDHDTKLRAAALKATRNAASLPTDISFYRSIDNGLSHDVDAISSRVLNLTNKLIAFSASVDPQAARGKGKARLEDKDDVVDNFHSFVVDVMDQLFERTDTCIDQVLGRNVAPAIAINPPANAPAPPKRKIVTPKGVLDPAIHHASHLTKPQLGFKHKADNSDAPWYPSLSHKYNAKVPLGHVYTDADEDVNMEGSSTPVTNHPYRYEINHITYPSHVYAPASPAPPAPLSETPFTWVSTPEALQTTLTKLRAATEISVDLEHHSYRSYSGFLCLMQVSTRQEDFVVDVISLRDEMEVLNEVFTDPKIVKVFHGAESDIVWLQQDFNLYVVNLFDTFHASKLLDFPRHGLANLLEMYCDYIPDKRYQLADWRIRPLPTEMLEYARSDTHFLLFIYDNLRNALLDRAISRSRSSSPPSTNNPNSSSNSAQQLSTPPPTANASTSPAHTLINHVLTRSAETCLRVYTKEPYDHLSGSGSTGWDTLAKKWNKPFFTASFSPSPSSSGPSNNIPAMQKAVYRAIHWWREKIAREEDESTRYVLPNQFLFRIAEAPPGDLAALLRALGSSPPTLVKKRAKELLDAVREAVKSSLGDSGREEEKVSDANEGENLEVEVNVKEVPVLSSSKEDISNEKIWGMDKTNETMKASSSLFGRPRISAIQQPARTIPMYATARSMLLGKAAKHHSTSIEDQTSSGSVRFQELVAKINSTLVIVPTVPKIIDGDAEGSTTSTTALEDATGMQIELPFVPAAQRQTITRVEEKEKDTIVVVGQSKAKKRKRTKANAVNQNRSQSKDEELKPETDTNDDNTAEAETFDFASVPNILDDNPDVEDRKPVKKKQRKGKGGQFFGDFPAPPKAHSEFKGGNQSHTFK